jgi:plasmid stabilization system protein ParE
MSASINLRDVEEIINSLVKKGVEYAVALYPFFFSFDEERYRNVVETIRSTFGEDVAEKVYREIAEAFKTSILWQRL